ncbi:MAG: HEAT repeat domain-containing protein [bacterium]|nr:HEAT repeat domain-containing protein [bacterium]
MSIKIFISTSQDELKKEKNALIKVMKKDLKLQPIYYDPQRDKYTSSWQQDNIKGCDIYIMLIDNTISQVIYEELEIARYYKKHIFIFVKNEDLIKDKQLKGKGISEERLNGFYKIIRGKYHTFSSFEEIKNKTIENLISLLELTKKLPSNLPIAKDEIDKVLQIYVKPKNKYAKAHRLLIENKCLYICGPAHIGKAIMAISLLLELKNEYNLDTIIRCKVSQVEDIFNIKNAGILFDNIFNGMDLKEENLMIKNIFDSIEELKKNNYVVVTLKRKEFQEMLFKAEKIENIDMKSYIDINEETDYSDDDLQKILKKHLTQVKKVENTQIKLIEENIDKIITELRFPHNIEHFVNEHLQDVKDENSLLEAINEAKEIDKFIENWFCNLSQEERFVVFTIALYEGFTEEEFRKIYEKVYKILRAKYLPKLTFTEIKKIRRNISSYITSFGNIAFRHPSYHNGVLRGIEDKYFEMATVILKELSGDPNWMIRLVSASSLGDLSKIYFSKRQKSLSLNEDGYAHWSVKPKKILPILESLAQDPIWNIRWVAASSLGEIVEKLPKKVIPILINLSQDKEWHVRQMAAISLRGVIKKHYDELIPAFERLSRDENQNNRWIAINTLCDVIETKGDVVIPILEKIAKNSVMRVKSFIQDNIEKEREKNA